MRWTYKQQLFIEHYLYLFNGEKSAILAGYSERSARKIASELLTKPDIKEAIRIKMQALEREMKDKKLKYLNVLNEIIEKAEKDENKIKAIQEIAKMLGFNEVQKHDVTSNGESLNEIKVTFINSRTE
jgi:phage terminase small subunit